MIEYLLELDGNVLLWMQENLRCDVVTEILTRITHLGNSGMIWIVITAVLLVFKKTRKVGVMSTVALLATLLVDNIILKNLVARTRPYEVVTGLERLIEKQWDYSFPSGHTGSSFAAAVVYYRELPKKYGIPAVCLAVSIAFSRLYLGVHYPSDVISGAVIGAVMAICSCLVVQKIMDQRAAKGIQ